MKAKPVTINGTTYASVSAAARALGLNVATLQWRLAQGNDPTAGLNERQAMPKPKLVSLRIDTRTVILVKPENATPEYAELWKARRDACEKGSKRDVVTMNDLIKKQKEQRKADARREKRKRK